MKTRNAIALILLAVLVMLALVADRWLRPMDVQTERAAARQAGLPLTPADMPLPAYPPSQDAAPDWKALEPLLKKMDDNPAWTAVDKGTGPGGSLADVRTADLRRLMSGERATLGMIHRAASKPGRTLSRGWGPDALMPEFATMRTATKLLRWESLLMAREGRTVDAVRNQALGFRIAAQADEDPILIGYLVGVAIEAISIRGMEDILREAPPSAALSDAVRRAIREDAPKYDLTRDIKGETLFGVTALRQIHSISAARVLVNGSDPTVPAVKGPPSAFVRRYFQEPNEAVYLHYMTQFLRAGRLPAAEREAAFTAISARLHGPKAKGPAYYVTSVLMPVYGKVYTRQQSMVARRAVLLAGTEALAYRAAHGAFPDRLTGARFIDPFTGKPLGYRRTAKGFVVYSAGEDKAFSGQPGPTTEKEAYFSYPEASLYTPAQPRNAFRTRSRPGGPPMPFGPQPSLPGGPPMPGGPPSSVPGGGPPMPGGPPSSMPGGQPMPGGPPSSMPGGGPPMPGGPPPGR